MKWMKYRLIYLVVSGSVIIACAYSLITWGLKLGIDFKGGTLIEYKFEKAINTEDFSNKLKEKGLEITSIQTVGENKYLLRMGGINLNTKDKLASESASFVNGKVEEIRFENVGPSIGPELIKKTMVAILVASVSILLWVAWQFKSIKFGASAILAMFHDTFIVIGVFSLLGHFVNVEIDFLFVTAVLTTLSFSVHDTIVVYDRVRETQKKFGGDLVELADSAITQTMVRSLNNSFTILFMLTALFLLGGTTTKWFALALLVGTVSGTYSSPFIAVPLLVTWDELESKLKRKKF